MPMKFERVVRRLAVRSVLLGLPVSMLGGPALADHLQVFLLGGQSNMDGRANDAGLPPALQLPQTDVLFYEGGVLRDLQPGSGTDFGPEVTLGRTLADEVPADSFALIKYGQGGTSLFQDWNPSGGSAFNTFQSTVSSGLAALTGAGHTFDIAGMIWVQGERDARLGQTTLQYETNLNGFISALRSSYGPTLPFYFNRLSVHQTDLPALGLSAVRQAQENVAAADANAYLIDTDGLSIKSDNLHYDAAGQIDLGEAFAQTFIDPNWVPPDPDPDPDPFGAGTAAFDLNHTSSVAPGGWTAVTGAQSGNGGSISLEDTGSGLTVTLTAGNGQSDLLARRRVIDSPASGPAVTLDPMFEDFFIRVGTIEVANLTPNAEYDLSFIMFDDDEPNETVVQTLTNTTDGASDVLGQVSWSPATGLTSDDDQQLSAAGLIADANGRLTFSLTANGNGGNALLNGLIVAAVTEPADLSGDGDVDDEDLGLFFSAFTGPDSGPSSNPAADLSGDGDVDDEDLGQAFSAFTGPLGPANVPEPAGLCLLLPWMLAMRRPGGWAALPKRQTDLTTDRAACV